MLEYTYKTRVYYRDVDQMGIVYYSRYLEYFEAARTELLRSIDFDITKIEKMGYYLPVIACHCDFQKPATFNDEISVITKITNLPRATLKILYEICDSTDQLLVVGYTNHAFVNSANKTSKPPKKLIEKLRGYYV